MLNYSYTTHTEEQQQILYCWMEITHCMDLMMMFSAQRLLNQKHFSPIYFYIYFGIYIIEKQCIFEYLNKAQVDQVSQIHSVSVP